METALFDLVEDPTYHIVLQKIQATSETAFYADIRRRVLSSERKDVFVFIHGYNTTFKDAARQTAQITYDLKFDGAPILYSWPSEGKKSKYPIDETNIEWTVPHLVNFLTALARQSRASKIHLIAHSMGARALVLALDELNRRKPSTQIFNQIILAAPDIDTDAFLDLARAIGRSVHRITLYASSKDVALRLSKRWHGYPRAGDSGSRLVIASNIDTVDASFADTDSDLFGHSYFSHKTILSDVYTLIRSDDSPVDRWGVFPATRDGASFWAFHP